MRFHLLGLMALLAVVACSAETPASVEPGSAAPIEDAAVAAATYSFARTEAVPGEPKDILIAQVGNQTYEIEAFEYSLGNVALEQDLNGDGTVDAIVSVHGGGNCCPADYYFVANQPNGEFVLTQIPEIYAWDDPVAEDMEGAPVVRFISVNEGMNTQDYLETTHVVRFEGETPVIVSKSVKEEVSALAELRSSVFADGGEGRKSFSYDLNGDGSQDDISCAFWDRWGRLTDCEADLEDGDQSIGIDASCKRLGVVEQESNGLKELVCDAEMRLAFSPVSGKYTAD